MFPTIEVGGTPYECGLSYGRQAAKQIATSIAAYRAVFAYWAGWDWPEVIGAAQAYLAPIRDLDPQLIDEMQGIADGANVDFADILAINTRTEVMFAAKARSANAQLPRIAECTSFAVVPDSGPVLLGENWDWLTHCYDTVVILKAKPAAAPAFVTVVEAGLLAKFGMNSAGIGLVTNALVTRNDIGAAGIPYHVMLRALLGTTSPTKALELLQSVRRSSSANYLITHSSGLAVDIEGAPGDWRDLHLLHPDERGVLLHANHFLTDIGEIDITRWAIPDSPFRMQKATQCVRLSGDLTDVRNWQSLLRDHAGFPYGVCAHETGEKPAEDSFATICSAIMQPASSRMWLAHGKPCTAEYTVHEFADFFAN